MSFSSNFAKPKFDSLKTLMKKRSSFWIPLTSSILAALLLFAFRNSTGFMSQTASSSKEDNDKEPIVLQRNQVWDRMMAL